MKSLQLGTPLEVDIEISDPVPTDAESEADLSGLLSLTKLSAQNIKQLRAVGIKVKRQGILETQRGTVYVTQAWLLGASSALYRLMMAKAERTDDKPIDADEVCKLADHLAKLAGKQAELSAVMLSHEPKADDGHTPPPAAAASFPAGAVVVGGDAHFYPNPPAEKGVAPIPNGS